MINILVFIFVLGCSSSVGADDLLKVPSYDGALLWQAGVDRLLSQIAEDLRTLIVPAEGRLSSRFGMRQHPLLGITKQHDGIDIACKAGTPVRAVLSGIVGFSGREGGYGQLIELQHTGEQMKTRYGHLSRMLVKRGQRVKRGDIIAYSGNTGLSTGPHLHFQLYHQGRIVNPERYLGKRVVPVLAGMHR